MLPLFFAVLNAIDQGGFKRDQQRQHKNGPNSESLSRQSFPQVVVCIGASLIPDDEELQHSNQHRSDDDHSKRQRSFQLQRFGMQNTNERHQEALLVWLRPLVKFRKISSRES